jgi:hypothetical protein
MKKRWFFGVAILFLVILIMRGIPFLINLYLNDNAERIVSNMITRTSGFGDHQVKFGEINLDYNYSGTFLNIADISVEPSEAIDERKVRISLKAKRLNISGFSWSSYFLSNSISINSAVLDDIIIFSVIPPLDSLLKVEDAPQLKENRDYDYITVGHFELNNFTVKAKDYLYDSLRFSMDNLSVLADNFQLRKEDLHNPKSLFNVDQVEGHLDRFELHFDEYRQYVLIQDIELDMKKENLLFGSFDLLHKQGKYEYTGQMEYRKGYLTIHDAQVEAKGVDYNLYLNQGILVVDTLITQNLRLESFADLRKKEDMERRPMMINEAVNNLTEPIHIRFAQIRDSHIQIEERPDNQAPVAGSMFFSEVNANISNISNYKDIRGENDVLEIDASGRLMGQGLVKLNVTYALDNDEGRFRLKGSMGPMDLTLLNSMIEPEAKISLKTGKLNRVDFNILGNNEWGEGDLIVRYENLEIELLNQDFEKDRNLFRRIGTFLANKVVIKSANPKNNGELREGKVYFERVRNKSMFNYWWMMILSGLKSTITGDDPEPTKKTERKSN